MIVRSGMERCARPIAIPTAKNPMRAPRLRFWMHASAPMGNIRKIATCAVASPNCSGPNSLMSVADERPRATAFWKPSQKPCSAGLNTQDAAAANAIAASRIWTQTITTTILIAAGGFMILADRHGCGSRPPPRRPNSLKPLASFSFSFSLSPKRPMRSPESKRQEQA
jgi:hypothetical protein